jgi:hypothetical protein
MLAESASAILFIRSPKFMHPNSQLMADEIMISKTSSAGRVR